MTKRIPNTDNLNFAVKPLHMVDHVAMGVTDKIRNAWCMADRLNYMYSVPYAITNASGATVGICDTCSG